MKTEKQIRAYRECLLAILPMDFERGMEQEAFLAGVVRGAMISALNWVLEAGEMRKRKG